MDQGPVPWNSGTPWQAAPPILFPYAREHVHQLTRDAPHGPVLLQPFNVQELLANWQATPPS